MEWSVRIQAQKAEDRGRRNEIEDGAFVDLKVWFGGQRMVFDMVGRSRQLRSIYRFPEVLGLYGIYTPHMAWPSLLCLWEL